MAEYQNFTRRDMENDCVACEDVHLSSGTVCTVYISPSSIYVLSHGQLSPQEQYREIQDLLGAVRIRLYLLPSATIPGGLYDPETDEIGPEMEEDVLAEDIDAWLSRGRIIYAPSARERMVFRLKGADIQGRGYAVDENGEIFLLRNGTVKRASPLSSELQYYLTAFLGPLGVHRFALGKPFSGLLYLLTGGFLLAGWFIDLLHLFTCTQKDSQKRYLLPLSNLKVKLLMLPLALPFVAVFFGGYLKVSELFGFGLQNLVTEAAKATDPEVVQNLIEALKELFAS